MSSPQGAQPPLCSYSPLPMRPQAAPHQATVHTLLPPPVPSSSSFSFSLSLPSPRSTPACVLHKCCVAGSPPYEVTGSWGAGHRLHMCLSLTMFPALVLYCIVLSSLYYRVLLSYCIVYYSQSHSIPILTSLRGQLHTNKQTYFTHITVLYYIVNVSLISAYHYTCPFTNIG